MLIGILFLKKNLSFLELKNDFYFITAGFVAKFIVRQIYDFQDCGLFWHIQYTFIYIFIAG